MDRKENVIALYEYIKALCALKSRVVGYKNCWERLITTINDTVAYADSIVADLLGKSIEIDNTINHLQLKSALEQMQGIFQKKGTISKLDLFFHRKLKIVLEAVKINGTPIANLEECICVQKKLLLLEKRSQTANYWNELMSARGVPHFDRLGDDPERVCFQQIPHIQRYLEWHQNEYDQLLQLLRNAGLNSDLLFADNEFDSEIVKTKNILKAIHDSIPTHIQLATIFIELKEMEERIFACAALLENCDRQQSSVCVAVSHALNQRDLSAYVNSFTKLAELYAKYSVKEQRLELLAKLDIFSSRLNWVLICR